MRFVEHHESIENDFIRTHNPKVDKCLIKNDYKRRKTMPIKIKKFDPLIAGKSNEGTILFAEVIPDGYKAPFKSAYGYLLNNQTMAGHAHETDEIYIVLSGTGYVTIGEKNREVSVGEVVAIPPNTWHTMMCTNKNKAPFIWAALWWDHIDGAEAFGKEICVQRFEKDKAYKSHQETILADKVVPATLKTPFEHAFGYLENGNTMELHAHPTNEFYIVFSGKGFAVVGDESAEIGPRDVIAIPPNKMHTMTAQEKGSLLWAALWWEHID
jgi:mannose-6-phosphate isomerase-like protein (cupin superfamily)